MKKSLKDILGNIIPKEHLWKIELFKQWNTIIGPSMKGKITIEKIDANTLFLHVSHPAWAQEILLLTPLLKQKINACFSEPKIASIKCHYRIVPYKAHHPEPVMQQRSFISPQDITLNTQELCTLDPLKSNDLRLSIAAYLHRCKRLHLRVNNKEKRI